MKYLNQEQKVSELRIASNARNEKLIAVSKVQIHKILYHRQLKLYVTADSC